MRHFPTYKREHVGFSQLSTSTGAVRISADSSDHTKNYQLVSVFILKRKETTSHEALFYKGLHSW